LKNLKKGEKNEKKIMEKVEGGGWGGGVFMGG